MSLKSHPVAEQLAAPLADALAAARLSDLPAVKISVYREDVTRELQPSQADVQSVYGSVAALAAALKTADPQAVEATLRCLGLHDANAIEALAIRALREGEGWRQLQEAAARVLGRCQTEASFQALLDHVHHLAAGYELRQNQYAHGAALVLEAALSHPAFTPNMAAVGEGYDGTQRLGAQALLSYFGQAPLDPTVAARSLDLLRRVYAQHPEHAIRLAAGHALCDRGDPESLALLIERENATDKRGVWFAARALIQLSPETAFQRLAPRLDEPAMREQVVQLLLKESNDAGRKHPEVGWVPADWGFIPWLQSLVKDKQYGQTAKGILGTFRGPLPKPPPTPRVRAKAPTRALEKAVLGYLEVPNRKTWTAIARATSGQPLNEAAQTLVAPAAERFVDLAWARLTQIHSDLVAAGYQFIAKAPLEVAPKSATKQLAKLEAEVGLLPVVLRAWLRRVGSVDLRGARPPWGPTHTELSPNTSGKAVILSDPLVVGSLADALDALDDWQQPQPFEFPLAPDAVGKAGQSGGEVVITWAGPTLDAHLTDEDLSFADWLRASLEAGGFPGLVAGGKLDEVLAKLVKSHQAF